jgi:hypothetical protein
MQKVARDRNTMRHAIAYITSIPSAKLEDYVDDYYSVERFRAAYEGVILSILDKTMWPKATHDFFLCTHHY